MSLSAQTGRYSNVAVALHWLVAIGIIFNLWKGLGFEDLEAAHSSQLRAAIDLHKSIGITVIGLVTMRILWKIGHPAPGPMAGLQPWERKLSVGVHHLLYLLMVLVPLSGWLHDSAWSGAASHPMVLFGVVPWFRLPLFGAMAAATRDFWHDVLGGVHGISAKVLIGAVLLHVVGALKHQFIDGKAQFRRMWFGA